MIRTLALLIAILIAKAVALDFLGFQDATYIISTDPPAGPYTCSQDTTPRHNELYYVPLGPYQDTENGNLCTYNRIAILQISEADLAFLRSFNTYVPTGAGQILAFYVTPPLSVEDKANGRIVFRPLLEIVNMTTVTEVSSGIDGNLNTPPQFDPGTYSVNITIADAEISGVNPDTTSRLQIDLDVAVVNRWLAEGVGFISVQFYDTVDPIELADPLDGANYVAIQGYVVATTTTTLATTSSTTTTTIPATTSLASSSSTVSTAAVSTATAATANSTTASTATSIATVATTTSPGSGSSNTQVTIYASVGTVSGLLLLLLLYGIVHYMHLRRAHNGYRKLEDHKHKKHLTRI